MQAQDTLKAKGQLTILLLNEHGNIKDRRDVDNLVVTSGLSYLASRATSSSPPTLMSHMAVGTGNTAAALGQTALVAEVGRAVMSAPSSAGGAMTFSATFGPGVGTGALTEAGIFNASSAGTMLSRTVFGTITKAAGDSLSVTWTITLA